MKPEKCGPWKVEHETGGSVYSYQEWWAVRNEEKDTDFIAQNEEWAEWLCEILNGIDKNETSV
jgi:hypothetical protein